VGMKALAAELAPLAGGGEARAASGLEAPGFDTVQGLQGGVS
jgi:hypothetical protein